MVVSIDGDEDVHDAVRRVRGGVARIRAGVAALRQQGQRPRVIARSVVQRMNMRAIGATIDAASRLGCDEISFLAADVSTAAFNRAERWPSERIADVAPVADELPALEQAIAYAEARWPMHFQSGFVTGGRATLDRILQYYTALAGRGPLPRVRCNAPWISAVLEPGGTLRPCFFHEEYAAAGDLDETLNSPSAIDFRRRLDVGTNQTCQRCVCSLDLPLTAAV